MARAGFKAIRSVRLALAATAMGSYILAMDGVHAVSFEACERPSCASKDDILRMMKAAESQAGARQSQKAQSQASTSASGEVQPAHVEDIELKECDCPPDRAELGFHSWQLVSFSCVALKRFPGITSLHSSTPWPQITLNDRVKMKSRHASTCFRPLGSSTRASTVLHI